MKQINPIPPHQRENILTRETLTAYCLTFADASADCPFQEEDFTVLRHKSNGKWFALIFHLDGKLCVNLKCDPMEADFFRRAYAGVRPAWHMNKTHWNLVEIGADVPESELFSMIEKSFSLTAPKQKRRKEHE